MYETFILHVYVHVYMCTYVCILYEYIRIFICKYTCIYILYRYIYKHMRVCIDVMCFMIFCPSRTDLTDQSIRDRLDGSESSFLHPFSRRGFCLPHSFHPSLPHSIPTARFSAALWPFMQGSQEVREGGRKVGKSSHPYRRNARPHAELSKRLPRIPESSHSIQCYPTNFRRQTTCLTVCLPTYLSD